MRARRTIATLLALPLLVPVFVVGGLGVLLMKATPLHGSEQVFRFGHRLAMWSLKALAWIGRKFDPRPDR